MPSFQDSAVIILLGLLLFGPKGLAKVARQLGKLVGEFRRASAEFRLQMEDELRLSEQEEQQKKIAAIEAAAPPTPAIAPAEEIPEPDHPHMPPPDAPMLTEPDIRVIDAPAPEVQPAPLPISSNGDLHMMPPATGLPLGRTSSASLNSVFDSIPHTPDPAAVDAEPEHEAAHNG